MKKSLAILGKSLCSWGEIKNMSLGDWEKITANTTVVLMAGGESSRFREFLGSENIHKNAFELPNGDTMMQMTIRMYRQAGFQKFLALVAHSAQSIIDLLGDSVEYCFDPEKPSGKGGAIRHAFETGKLSNEDYFIVHNPDDIILGEPDFPRKIMESHVGHGGSATIVVCEGTPYTYTGMQIDEGKVTEVEMYPFIPIPTHIGVTVFSPRLKGLFEKTFEYGKKADFEKILLPKLSDEGKLYAVGVPFESWVPVNNLKNYKLLLERLGLTDRN